MPAFKIPNSVFAAALTASFAAAATAQVAMPERMQTMLDTYCNTCHNIEDWAGQLDLTDVDHNDVMKNSEVWEKVLRKMRGSMMPPKGQKRPDDKTKVEFMGWLQQAIDKQTLAKPNPGKSSLHRLNRSEYGNAVRDLLDLQVDISEYLPADDEGYGFDNIADVLRTSPSLLEQYLSASRKISELAVGDMATPVISKAYRPNPDLPHNQHIPGLPLGTRGGVLIEHNFPLDGEYQIDSYLVRNIVGYMTGLEWEHGFEISIDGEQVFLSHVGGKQDNLASDRNFAQAADTIDARLKARIPVKAGLHKVAVTFLQKNAAETHEPLELHTRNLDLQDMVGVPTLDYVNITGPYKPTGKGDTASRRRIFTCHPRETAEQQRCAEQVLGTLGKRAWRRPLTASDMALLMNYYEQGAAKGDFENGIQTALRFVLTSPEFLFRNEQDPQEMKPGTVYALSDLALASRLSFFLWSSIPDDELLTLAEQNKLHEEKVLEQQVKRMLKDPKSTALVDNFVAQWLFLRNLKNINPDTRTFPNFDDKLRQAFKTETMLFIDSIIKNDAPILDMINADYTYVNDRLAEHYNIPNVYGSHFRRVKLTDPNRRGLLGQGSVLTVTSYPTRTSPVLRGKWILENIIGSPPPTPPANVPALSENKPGQTATSVKARLESHRADPACRSCHAVMDPLGFSLENFDAIGRFRAKDAAGAIDASGELADGTPVSSVVTLEQVLMKHPEYFVDTFTEKLMTYALGRGLEYYDMPIVRDVTGKAKGKGYSFSAVVLGIVKSPPFRMKMKPLEGNAPAVADNAR